MLLLITDTSGRNGNVALATAEVSSDQVKVIEAVPLAGGTFSAQLIPQIAALLSSHDYRKSSIDAFIVVSGPGSFTGLRVGLSAIKGLAEILEKPIVPVSLLEVVAVASNCEGKVISVLDAGRSEIYAGEYQIQGSTVRPLGEQLLSRDELLSTKDGSPLCTSDTSVAEMADLAGFSTVAIETISIEMIARVGWRKLQAGETAATESLDANYIRRTVAEIYPKPTA
jgi:tRNA threonylcarbamoyladenosine biosynthesis protein TsaB